MEPADSSSWECRYQAATGRAAHTGLVSEHTELGAALRAWRDRLAPADAGLPDYGPRRAPGLRREELALLAGMSADYVTRLEQGRASAPSVQVLTALARALRLTGAEREHLFVLAGQPLPGPGIMPTHLTPGLQRLLDQLSGIPVCVNDAGWTLLAWNPLWAALVGDPAGQRGRDRNVLWRHFTGAPGRVTHTPEDEPRFEASAVADLRAATARYPLDAGLRDLVTSLRAASSRFARLWDGRDVGAHERDRKTVHHPDLGPITVDCDVLTVAGSDLRVVAFTAAPGSEDADKLRLLAVLGTEDFSQRV
jgi:transcriptional regulator with XRE-family HTH domain